MSKPPPVISDDSRLQNLMVSAWQIPEVQALYATWQDTETDARVIMQEICGQKKPWEQGKTRQLREVGKAADAASRDMKEKMRETLRSHGWESRPTIDLLIALEIHIRRRSENTQIDFF